MYSHWSRLAIVIAKEKCTVVGCQFYQNLARASEGLISVYIQAFKCVEDNDNGNDNEKTMTSDHYLRARQQPGRSRPWTSLCSGWNGQI